MVSKRPIRPLVKLGHPIEAHGRFPAFQSIEEEAEFWYTHDFTDFLDEFDPVEFLKSPDFRSSFNFIFRLDFDDWEEITAIAAERAIDYHALMLERIKERLNQERKAS